MFLDKAQVLFSPLVVLNLPPAALPVPVRHTPCLSQFSEHQYRLVRAAQVFSTSGLCFAGSSRQFVVRCESTSNRGASNLEKQKKEVPRMFLTRWQPFLERELDRLQNEVNQLWGHLGWGRTDGPGLSCAYPAVNVWDDAECVYAEAELPGMTQDQLQIYVTDGNQLTIMGERKPPELPKGVWHRQERGFGKFQRVVQLPVPVDADKVEAKLEQGVLCLKLSKSASAKPRRIPVKGE
jgi:HSP20 family protein